MKKQQPMYVPAPQKRGCGFLVLPFLFVVMLFLLFVVAPQIERYKTAPAQPGWVQQFQNLLPGASQPTPKTHSSVPLTSPSGSCFNLARAAAIQNGIDPTLYARQINQESGCQSSVCSSAGACGVAQLMPEMAKSLGVNPMNVAQSLSAGAHLMAGYLKAHNGSWSLALACYNAGSGAVQTALSYGANWLAHLPAETQHYIASILGQAVQA